MWWDVDENGRYDDHEDPAPGVTIVLIHPDGLHESTVTNEHGKYLFAEKTPGNYRLMIVLDEKEYLTGYKTKGVSEERDSDFNISTNSTMTINIPSATTNLNIDAGLYKKESSGGGHVPKPPIEEPVVEDELGSIGDYVWLDLYSNGIQENFEPFLSGVEVTLEYPSGSRDTTQTNSKGKYLFDDLEAGTYKIIFEKPRGLDFTSQMMGERSSKDSDPNSSGVVSTINLDKGQDLKTIDAGLVGHSSIGNYVWLDENKNGIQDSGEEGVRGVRVDLYYKDTFLMTDNTNANGEYLFDNLSPGTYKVKFFAPDDHQFTDDYAGERGNDSDADFRGFSGDINLGIDENDMTVDAGIVDAVSIDVDITDGNTGDPVDDSKNYCC